MNATRVSVVGLNLTTEEPPGDLWTDYYDGNDNETKESGGAWVCLDRGADDVEGWVREGVRLMLSTTILLSNSFIVVAVLRLWAREGSPLGKSAAASFLVFNLAVADALVGFSAVLSWIQDDVCFVYELMALHPATCMMGHVTTQFFDCASTVNIVVIAVDRVMSVSQTARCRNFLNSRRVLGVIACIWVIGLFLALTVFMIPGAYTWAGNESHNSTLVGQGCDVSVAYEESMLWGTVSIMLMALFGCYWRIHRVTLKMLRRGSISTPRKQAGTKAARMLLVIFAWDSFAYLPLLITTVMRMSGVNVMQILVDVASNLTLLTFLADPFIYAFHNQQTKKAILDLATCLRRDELMEVAPPERRASFPGTSMKRFRQIISTITNSSSASDEEKANRQSPIIKRNSLIGTS